MRYKIKLSGASPGTNQIVLPSSLAAYLGEDIAVWHRSERVRAFLSSTSLDLDGTDDYLTSTQNLGLSGNAEFTLECWIKWNGAAWVSYWPSVMGTKYGGSPGDYTNKVIALTFYLGKPALDFWNNRYIASSALSLNTLYHVAATKTAGYIASTSKLFINGEEITGGIEGTNAVPNVTNAPPLIGKLWYTNPLAFFDGIVFDVRFWNYARSASEINRDKNKLLSGNEPGLVAYYPLTEPSGTTAFDQAGSNHLTHYGTPSRSSIGLQTLNFQAPLSPDDEIEIGTGTPLPFEPEAANSAAVADWRPATGTYWYFPRSPFYDMKVKVDSTWKQVVDVKVKIAGEWKEVTGVWHKQAGSWNKVGE